MIVQIVLATLLVGDGRTMELTPAAGGCDYGYQVGALKNSADLTLAEVCWRLNPSNGHIEFDSMDSRLVEEFDWTPDGVVWIRRIIR